jgi:hypothetical protein
MKVDSGTVFSMLNRLADIVQEEGITAHLPDLIGERFGALDVEVVLPKQTDAPAEEADAAAMRTAIAAHWAIVMQDHEASTPPGPRIGGVVAEAYTPTQADDPQAIADGNLATANEIRNLAAGVLDMETAKTPQDRLTGMSFVRQALDVLAKSGMTLLEDRFAAVAGRLQDEAAQVAANALHGLRNDEVVVGRKIDFRSSGEKLTFPDLIAYLRADLESKNQLEINPSDMATEARRIAHRIDTLIRAVESAGHLNTEILKELATDVQTLANVSSPRPSANTPAMLMDQLPDEIATAIRAAIKQTKLLYHFGRAYTKVPLPPPNV